MPRVIDNEDGTKTFTINSSELRVLKSLFAHRVPDFKKISQFVATPEFKATVDFFKSVMD